MIVCLSGNLNADNTVQGYELYSSTIADVLSEPSLRTPITVGLFARWGSGKSFLIGPLRRECPTTHIVYSAVYSYITYFAAFLSIYFA